jgi:putative flavoprotein involved in K+ transport
MTAMIKRAVVSVAGKVDVVVIGAGHSGLAMSRCLTARSINHVVLERGEVANTWRHERWDSLRLLTPNWMSRLPGYRYSGNDPDGYMSMQDVIAFISGYAEVSLAPVKTGTTVTSVEPYLDGYRVISDRGEWRCRAVVVASGAFNVPLVPAIASAVPHGIKQLTPRDYRNPGQIEAGGVLVVGASATGLQLADELRQAGHAVTIAVGEHVRLPRVYRGRDIQWWMHAAGVLDERYDTVDDIVRARRVPSPQLIGSRDRRILDLNALTANGVRLAGRLVGMRAGKAQFSGSLRNVCALADLKMDRLLGAIDRWAIGNGYASEFDSSETFEPTKVAKSPCLNVGLGNGEIRTIVWATGFRADYSWLNVPVLDRKGQIRHEGGVADAPGMYVMGLPFLRRRKSTFIHGAEDDARDLAEHISGYLDMLARSQLAGMAA